ncbi:MAG: response regulator transcription factor [Peptococcaceae bacterium]
MLDLLIVDDEYLERMVLKHHIEKDPSLRIKIVGEAASGREAIAMFLKANPVIILMDIKMPELDGLQTAEIIKQHNSAVEIIFITAYSYFSYAKEAIKVRPADYLLKPVRPAELYASIRKAIQFTEERKAAKLTAAQHHDLPTAAQLDENFLIGQIKNYIANNFKNKITLDELAQIVHYNPSYISSLFKKTTGLGINDYITNIRIDEAKILLVDTDKSIDDIAAFVGLSNNSYITYLFKKSCGITPSAYRRLYTKVKK